MQGRRRPYAKPLAEEQVLTWADAHHARTGRWPARASGPVPEAPGETWEKIHCALYEGSRGLPGGDTLARLLDRHQRGRRKGVPGLRSNPWTPGEDDLVR